MRKIVKKLPERVIASDLRSYKKEAVRLGASDAKIVRSSEVIIDDRAVAKCAYPKCPSFGTNANCPPYCMKPDETKRIVAKYKHAIVVTIEGPPEAFAGSLKAPPIKQLSLSYRMKMYEIVSRIETLAFYDGHYFALGFAGGSCKAVFCGGKECLALKPGKGCRFPLKARPSMEGVGMDVFGMVVRLGWDIYPCGSSLSPKDVPFGRRVGIVLIC